MTLSHQAPSVTDAPIPSPSSRIGWRVLGLLALFVFIPLAFLQVPHPDPLLWIALYVGAAVLGVPLIRGRPVPGWAALAVSVVGAELALMTTLFPPQQGGPSRPGANWTGDTTVDLIGCALVCLWGASIVWIKPNEARRG